MKGTHLKTEKLILLLLLPSLFQHFESAHEQDVNSGVHENLETKTEDNEITIENIEYGKTEYSCPICKNFIDNNVEHEILNLEMINQEDNANYQILKGRTGNSSMYHLNGYLFTRNGDIFMMSMK